MFHQNSNLRKCMYLKCKSKYSWEIRYINSTVFASFTVWMRRLVSKKKSVIQTAGNTNLYNFPDFKPYFGELFYFDRLKIGVDLKELIDLKDPFYTAATISIIDGTLKRAEQILRVYSFPDSAAPLLSQSSCTRFAAENRTCSKSERFIGQIWRPFKNLNGPSNSSHEWIASRWLLMSLFSALIISEIFLLFACSVKDRVYSCRKITQVNIRMPDDARSINSRKFESI